MIMAIERAVPSMEIRLMRRFSRSMFRACLRYCLNILLLFVLGRFTNRPYGTLFYFKFVLVFVACHVGDYYLVAGLQAADHFYIFVVAVT